MFFGFFLLVLSFFEILLFFPKSFYVLAAVLGLSSVVVLARLNKFGLKTAQLIWFAAGFLYLLSSLFFVMFINEFFLRHIIVFLVSFLIAFWIKRFYEFVNPPSPAKAGFGETVLGDLSRPERRDWSFKELDVYFLKVISFSSFYFGVSSIYGAIIFLGANPLAMLAFFVLWVLGCTILFWEPPFLFLKSVILEKPESPAQTPGIGGGTKYFLWGLVTVLCLESAAAVYFLPLSIFSMGAVVFLFWILLAGMLLDFNQGVFVFKKYRTRLILFALFIVSILLSIEWA